MPIDLILPLGIVMALVAYSLIARWYLMPVLKKVPLPRALEPLLLLHSFRYIGLALLIPGVTAVPLDPRFANPAAYGDLATAVLAFIAILALRKAWRSALAIVWIFNIVGTLDLLNAVTQGLHYTEDGTLGATYFIPAVVVPALLVTHVIIFRLLIKADSTDQQVFTDATHSTP